jgi:hypothetical protein
MSRPLVVWMTSDGVAEVVVAARSKTEAARLIGRSLYSFNQFASDLQDHHPIAQVALARPGVVLRRSNRIRHDATEGWEERP